MVHAQVGPGSTQCHPKPTSHATMREDWEAGAAS